jgi:hypothetical protein
VGRRITVIRTQVFGDADKLHTSVLLQHLCNRDESPWMDIYGLMSMTKLRFYSADMWKSLNDHLPYDDLQLPVDFAHGNAGGRCPCYLLDFFAPACGGICIARRLEL